MNNAANKVVKKLGELSQDVNQIKQLINYEEVSKRGVAIVEDVFYIQLSAPVTTPLQTVEANETIASDYDFVALKFTAGPISTVTPVNLWEFQIRDGSSDVTLMNDFIPANAITGVGQLPFIQINPRRFPARGSIIVNFRDLGISPVYPYTPFIVMSGKKQFYTTPRMDGQ